MATLKSKKEAEKTRQGVLLIASAICLVLALIITYLFLQPGPGCPACSQHYFLIDNSDALTDRQKNKISYPEGLLGILWKELATGEQLNILTFDVASLDAKVIARIEKPVLPADANSAYQNKMMLKKELDDVLGDLEETVQKLEGESLKESRILEAMHDIGVEISNHRKIHGQAKEDLRYTVTIYSDLLQNSEVYSFYNDNALGGGLEPSFIQPRLDEVESLYLAYIPNNIGLQDENFLAFWKQISQRSGVKDYEILPH
jgi:hypothetical protein